MNNSPARRNVLIPALSRVLAMTAAVNYGVLPLVALTLGATLSLMGRRRRAVAAE